jgi:mutator protein MutT
VLAARRTHPADVAGGWELPGGKVDPGESVAGALRREVREELGCEVELVSSLEGRTAIKPGYELTAHVVRLLTGEPVPHEHDVVRWLAPEELDDVDWLPSDRPFLPQLRELLLEGERLPGGNVGGATRIGATVRRATGAWTPAVHALLDHLAQAGLREAPRVLGIDGHGREVLSYLEGRVVDVDSEIVSADLLVDAMTWLRAFHHAVGDFRHPGPWRTVHRALAPGELICHHDFAPYNVAVSSTAAGERVAGVFDWDMAGPGLPVDDLAFAAWNWVPLHREMAAEFSAQRLQTMATAYGHGLTAAQILARVVPRIERSLEVIRAGQGHGDTGMLNLAKVGEPARTARTLDLLLARVPAIRAELMRAIR